MTTRVYSTEMLKDSFENEYLIHRELWRVAEQNGSIAAKSAVGSFYPALVSKVFAFHTIEAYVNFVGESIAPDIWEDARNYFRKEPFRGWDGKLRKVLELVGLPYDIQQPGLTTIVRLRYLRDLIAHGKPERRTGEGIHPRDRPVLPLPPSSLSDAVGHREELPVILSEVETFLDDIHKRARARIDKRWATTDREIWFGNRALRGPSEYGSHHGTCE